MPTPTPEFVKYITDIDGERAMPVNITPAQTPTPTITQMQSVSVPVYVETRITVKTTVPSTVKTPTPIPTTESVVIPLSPVLGIIALGIAWVIVWRR